MYPRTVSPWSITLSHIFWRGTTHPENWQEEPTTALLLTQLLT